MSVSTFSQVRRMLFRRHLPVFRILGQRLSVRLLSLVCLFLLIFLSAISAEADETIRFDAQVRPILSQHCLVCHGGLKQAGGLSMVWQETLLGESNSGKVIVPGDADHSLLIEYVTAADDDLRMPPVEHGRRLNEQEVAILRGWINQGANWELPWAFQSLNKPCLPKLTDQQAAWPRKPLDQFVLARLHKAGLAPTGEASRMAWLRRATFDLIGLPPTEAQRQAFQADQAEGAYERVVDRLLTSAHFGERWASVWLDLARYADTSGYEKDTHRDMWSYRDWVIRAFDADKPYNDFLVEQLAGDLLADATLEDQIATAFHRNTQTNHEGGTDDEEFRIAAVLDRVNTTWQATQGITFGCARCHDHTYDPITQEDYYRFYACLNSTQDIDLDEDFPKLAVPSDAKNWKQATAIDRELLAIRNTIYERGIAVAKEATQWHGLSIDGATSTGQTELTLVPVVEPADKGVEVVAGGTITDRSYYELTAPAPLGTLTALRLDALPKDIVEALRTPEIGFVLSRFRLFVKRADGAEQEIYFHSVFCSDPAPFFSAEESLSDTHAGWSAYSRFLRPRWAVFVLDQQPDGPLVFKEGDRLRLSLKHNKALDGQGALVIRRLRIATTDNPAWKQLRTDSALAELRLREFDLQTERQAIRSTSIPVMAELPAGQGRPTHLFERGSFLNQGKRLTPDMPKVFGFPTINDQRPARLQMAEAIVSDDNPLTARVWINRVWSELFGRGIVSTLDDFGTVGAKPTHPQLLDHLANEFIHTHGWQLKPLLREIVLSATYRQDAKRTEAATDVDPTNQWLSHGPRKRLRAEMIRDQALLLSGKFNSERFGKPVMPYQPDGVWQSVYNNDKWITSEGDDRFRRAIYTYWKRTAAYPSLRTFDAPSRELCTAQRPTTNTPLQALALLNDPVYHELAEGFAKQILSRGGSTIESQVAWAYEQATSQPANAIVIDELSQLYTTSLNATEQQHAAMTIVASALLNLDATLNN